MRRAKHLIWPVLLGCIALFYVNEIWRSSRGVHEPATHARAEHPQYEAKHDNIFFDAWNWTTQDPVSFYTFILAIFTGALVLVAGVQIRYLIRADITARRSAIAARRAAIAARKSAEHIPKVERAYLSGGGTGRVFGPEGSDNPAALFEFQVNNFGKTPGELREIRYGFLPMPTYENDFRAPEPPPYSEKLFWQDWYRPGIQSRSIPKHALITIGVPSVIFARLYYRDIFGAWHSSGFVLQLDHRAGSSPIKAPPSYTDERDEPDYKP